MTRKKYPLCHVLAPIISIRNGEANDEDEEDKEDFEEDEDEEDE